jgi:transcriptional regulator GlxA family with amidase domain
LFVLETDATGSRRLVLCTQSTVRPTGAGAILVSAEVDFGGDANPLLRSLPCELALTTAAGDPLWALTENFIGEAFQARCGGKAALARLGELLVLMLLRSAIDQGSTQPGVLAGLAHPRLRVAVAAMLKQPGKDWTMDALADCCSMSRSQFMADFRRFLGFTPGAFLSGWRMTLARRDLGRGERVKAVAARSGYTSAAAFSRAYSRAFGEAPGASRPGSSVEVASPARRGQSGNC